MHVAAAGADVVDADDHVSRVGDFGDGVVGDFGGEGALQPDCWILGRWCKLRYVLLGCGSWWSDLTSDAPMVETVAMVVVILILYKQTQQIDHKLRPLQMFVLLTY